MKRNSCVGCVRDGLALIFWLFAVRTARPVTHHCLGYAMKRCGQRPPLRERKAWPLASASAKGDWPTATLRDR
ncbi:MAG: hypothetical protein F6K55_10995 [Moorea sp. SIO4A3]|nr:hypothetical protein [Moorena sp. SIO4A3]